MEWFLNIYRTIVSYAKGNLWLLWHNSVLTLYVVNGLYKEGLREMISGLDNTLNNAGTSCNRLKNVRNTHIVVDGCSATVLPFVRIERV